MGDGDFRGLTEQFIQGRLSRRRFLEASALLGLGGFASLVVAACSSGTTATATAALTAAASASGASAASAAASLAATAPTASAAATTSAVGSAHVGGALNVAAAQGISQLDPYKILFAWEEVLYPVLWNALTGYTQSSPDVQPELASWTTSADLATYTFKLRPGIKFSNGKVLTADDVVADITRALDPKTVFIEAFLVPKIKTVKALDPSTVEFTLMQPSANLPDALAKIPIVDPASLGQINTNPIGTGRFTVKEFVPNDHVTLARNASYWGDQPALDTMKIATAQDPTAAVTSLRGGDLDVFWSVPWQDAKQMQSDGSALIVTAELPSASIIFETDNTSPPFNNVSARQALVYATDKQTMIDAAYAGKALISSTNQPIASNSEYFNSALPVYAFDLDKAKTLFAQGGINSGDTLTFWTTAGQYPEWTIYGQILQSDLAKIGIKLVIQSNEINTWVAKFGPAGKKFPGLLVPNFYSGAPAPQILSFWTPGICECNYNNPSYNSLLTQAAAAKDPATRTQLLGQAQILIAQDAPVVFIGQTSWPIAVRPSIKGVWEDPGTITHVETASLGS